MAFYEGKLLNGTAETIGLILYCEVVLNYSRALTFEIARGRMGESIKRWAINGNLYQTNIKDDIRHREVIFTCPAMILNMKQTNGSGMILMRRLYWMALWITGNHFNHHSNNTFSGICNCAGNENIP